MKEGGRTVIDTDKVHRRLPLGDRYVGQWANGAWNGQGIYTWKDGRVYSGEWAADKQNGKGVMTWPSGERYEGGWKNGNRHGQGSQTLASGGPLRRSMGERCMEWSRNIHVERRTSVLR